MLLSARASLQVAVAVTLAGWIALAGFAWKGFDDAYEEADAMSRPLLRLSRIERLEEDLHEIAARSPEANLASVERSLAALSAMEQPEGATPLLTELDLRIAEAKHDPTSENWSRAAEVMSELGKLEVDRVTRSAEDMSRPARSNARSILKLSAAVLVVGFIFSALAFVRLRRERRETEARLRRSDRLAVLGTMAASIAHELNNPLATIAGCATALRDRVKRRTGEGAFDADEVEYLDMVADEARRCSGIVRSLRDLARDTPPAMAPYDLRKLSDEVVHLVEISKSSPGVSIQVRGEPELEIVCDPDKVKQLLLNLLVNARDACDEEGRVTVTLARTDDGGARVDVEDDGRGIHARDLPRVFDPFHTGKARGLGLGLFVCERIASLHGGAIAAASDGPGRGARFTVSLPRRPPGPPPREGAGAPEPAVA